MIVSNWDKERLLRSTILAGFFAAGLAATPAMAQEADEPETTEEEQEEAQQAASGDRIVVTGSRIRRDEFTSASPIQVIDGELSRDLGLVDAADLVQQATVAQGQQIDLGLSTSAGLSATDNPSGPGGANLNLRGFGAGRTLVLINGRRLAPAGVRGAPSAPDVNMIPGTLVERVEILLDGASAVYGSDAVAGVANYILRDDFDGLEVDAYYTFPEMDAGTQQVYSATFGVSNDRGFIGLAGEYSEIGMVTNAEYGSFDPSEEYCSRTITQGASGQLYSNRCGGGTIGSGVLQSPFGFLLRDVNATAAQTGLPADGFRQVPIDVTVLDPRGVNTDDLLIHPEDRADSFTPDFRRVVLFGVGEYDLDTYGNMTAYFEGSYSYRETIDRSRGQQDIPIPGTNPLNPLNRNVNLFYNRDISTETAVDQARLIGGLRGDLPDLDFGGFNSWSYDAYLSYSRSEGNDILQGLLAVDRAQLSLENTIISPVTGLPACTPEVLEEDFSGSFPPTNCVAADFLDPFFIANGRFPDEEANRFFFPNRFSRTLLEQTVFSALATGNLFNLPGGSAAGVIGFEYREDKIRTETDRTASGNELKDDFVDLGATGQRQLYEAFGEIDLPLISGAEFAEELNINLATRYTNEQNFGSAWTWRAQGIYRPVDWLTFRATYGTSFRAPDVGEQFGSQIADFSNTRGAGDPCLTPGIAFEFVDDDNNPATPSLRVYNPTLDPRTPEALAQCINGGGVGGFPGVDPTNFGVQGAGTNNLVFLGVSPLVTEGANPDLEPETSDAFTIGTVVDQPWFDQFDLRVAVTYFDITVEDQVTELSEVEVVTSCYDGTGDLDDPLCTFMSRDPLTGFVSTVNAQLQNVGEITTRGIDINVRFDYDFNLPFSDSPFSLTVLSNGTRGLEQKEDFVNSVEDDLGEHGFPEWRANATVILGWQDINALWRTRYQSQTIEDNEDRVDPETSGFSDCLRDGETSCIFFDDADDYFVHDFSMNYSVDTWVVRAGVNNVFNEAPPFANVPIRGVGYDLGGRTFFANVSKSF
jgi:iron complex outermembrane receptor protein